MPDRPDHEAPAPADRGPAEACDSALAAIGASAVARELREGMLSRDLTADGEILCRTLRPKFVEEEDYRRLVAASRIALDLIGRAALKVRSDPALRQALFGSHPYALLIEGHLDHDIECVGRFDAMIDSRGTIRFIEYNAGLCGGAFCSESVAEVFAGSALLERIGAAWPFRFVSLRDRYLKALLDGFRSARGRAPKNIVVILPPGKDALPRAPNRELRGLIEFARANGMEARFAELTHIVEHEGSLRDQAGIVDLAVVVDWASTLAACPPDHRLWRSRAPDGTWISNSLGASALRSGKHLLAVLSDPSFGLPLGQHERCWIETHLPWTRMVAPGPATVGESRMDLVEWIEAHQASLVLKPCFSMGGDGVVLGWECSREEWLHALEKALLAPSIVQERVVVRPEVYPVVAGGKITGRRLAGDLCLYTWRGVDLGGLYCRLSENGPLNLGAAAAMLVPAFLFARGP